MYMIKMAKIIKEIMEGTLSLPPSPPAIIRQVELPKTNTIVLNKKQVEDAYIITATIWQEAKGEGEKGMHGVLNVIMNRSFGDFRNARNVALDPSQFSVWNKVINPTGKSINIKNQCESKTIEGCEMYPIAVKLVDDAMKNKLVDITKGALFFYNPYKVRPSWANGMTKTITIGNHRFCKPKK